MLGHMLFTDWRSGHAHAQLVLHDVFVLFGICWADAHLLHSLSRSLIRVCFVVARFVAWFLFSELCCGGVIRCP